MELLDSNFEEEEENKDLTQRYIPAENEKPCFDSPNLN